jgi:hypothetical protein
MLEIMASEVERFRARFRFEDSLGARQQLTPDERLRAAMDLHAFNLLLAIDKVRNQMEDAEEAAIVEEVNRRRLASSPMPLPLNRRPRRDAAVRSH